MIGFFLTTIKPPHSPLLALFFLYAVPLLYGILLRYTVYRRILDREYTYACRALQQTHRPSIFSALPDAINDALTQIAMLGGYMILFNALRIVPYLLFKNLPSFYLFTQSVLEISGGLLCINNLLPDGITKTMGIYAVFVFNGLCCHFQSFSLMEPLKLSGKKYMLHKIILCSITILFVWLYETFR